MKPSISACALAAPLLLLAATDADARETDTHYNLNIAAGDLSSELVSLATATGLSIGGLDPAQCHARPRSLRGRHTAEAALKTLLRDSACAVQRIDPVTYRLVARPAPQPQPRPKPTPRPAPTPVPPPAPGEPTLVVVRNPQTASRTAAGVSVVAPPLLSGNDTDLSRVAPQVSGMVVTNLGPGRDKIFLRGLSDSVLTGRTQSTVGLYLDDTAITYNAPDPDLLLVDMARIEVLKGPQGNLYGQGALSGVVRLVTRAPDPSHMEGQAGVSLGVTRGGQPSWRVTGMANLPLMHGAAAVRAVLYTEKSGGFIKADHIAGPAPLTDHGPPPLDRRASNDTGRAGGRLAFQWQPSEDLTVQATMTIQDLNSSNSQYVIGHRALFDEPLAVAEPHNNSFRNLSFGLTRRTEAGTFKLSLNRSRHKVRTGYDAHPIGRYVSIPNSGVLFFEEDQDFGLSTLEASFVSPPRNAHWQWLAGLFLARSDETFTPHLSDLYTENTLYDEHRADRVSDAALFGRLTWKPAPKWSLSAGLRVQTTRHDTDSVIRDVHLNNYRPDGHIVGRIEATPLSHEVMVSYQATPRLFLYGLAASGFRTGGFNTTTLINTAVPRAYAGDRLDSVETGFKYRSAGGAVALDMALFRVDWRDIQSDQLRATGLPMTLNLGDGINTGLESELAWRITPDLKVQLRSQQNQPKLRRVNPLLPRVARTGMPFIAKSSMSFTVQWDQAALGRRFNHVLVLSGRDGSALNYGVTPKVWMSGYVNLDLSSSTAFGPYTAGIRMTNALSTKSNSFAYGNPFAMDSASQITPLRPRTVWLSLSRSY